jgi:3-methyladenine DNA glycosylase/8-oxoguanine DNA glycosylase
VAAFGTAVTWREQRLWGFPAAPVVAATDPAELRELQFTWMKARSIVAVAEASATGALDGIEYEDHAGVVDRVTPIYGIGRWSADWLAARCLALPAVVAPGDLGVRQAIGAHYLGADRPATADEVGEVAATWGNAANWAVHLLLERLASG